MTRLIKINLVGTHNKMRIGNDLPPSFIIENSFKQGDALSLNYCLSRVLNLDLRRNRYRLNKLEPIGKNRGH